MLLSISVKHQKTILSICLLSHPKSKQKGETIQEDKIQTTHFPPLDPKTWKN